MAYLSLDLYARLAHQFSIERHPRGIYHRCASQEHTKVAIVVTAGGSRHLPVALGSFY
jgi:hypothetical protein